MSKEVPQPMPKMDKKALMENMEDKNIYEGRDPSLTHYSQKEGHKKRGLANKKIFQRLPSLVIGLWQWLKYVVINGILS